MTQKFVTIFLIKDKRKLVDAVVLKGGMVRQRGQWMDKKIMDEKENFG